MKQLFKKDNLIILFEIMVIGVILFPIIYTSMYAIPAYDDFCTAVIWKRILDGDSGVIMGVLKQIYTYYTEKGGYLFTLAISTFIQPYMWGGLTALRLAIVLINLVFYYSLWFFVSALLRNIYRINDKKILLGIYLLMILPFAVNNYYNDEIISWYTDMCCYVLVVACIFFGIGFLIKGICQNKGKWIVLACMFSVLSSGGALNIAALNCGAFLLILMWGGAKKRKRIFPCFACAFLGTIVNLLAPGNYVRHASIASDYSVTTAFIMAVGEGIDRLRFLFCSTPFVILVISIFIFSYKFIKDDFDYAYPYPLGLCVTIFIGIIIVNFPVLFGYAGAFPKRSIWIEDCVIYLGSFALAWYFAGWLKRQSWKPELRKDAALCIAVSCFLGFCSLGGESIEQIYRANVRIAKGDIRKFTLYWEDVLYEIEHSEKANVVITRETEPELEGLYDLGLIERTESWVNIAVAEYFDKESVSFVISSDREQN